MRTTIIVALVMGILFVSPVEGAQPHAHEQLGQVSFETSCDRRAQAQFNRAVAMLHSFWFQQGEKAFRDILEQDPSCAIANWGIASILIGNTFAGNATPARVTN